MGSMTRHPVFSNKTENLPCHVKISALPCREGLTWAFYMKSLNFAQIGTVWLLLNVSLIIFYAKLHSHGW